MMEKEFDPLYSTVPLYAHELHSRQMAFWIFANQLFHLFLKNPQNHFSFISLSSSASYYYKVLPKLIKKRKFVQQ